MGFTVAFSYSSAFVATVPLLVPILPPHLCFSTFMWLSFYEIHLGTAAWGSHLFFFQDSALYTHILPPIFPVTPEKLETITHQLLNPNTCFSNFMF